ncbi:MAG: TonB-dependent receptor [Bacteroidales bacterium]|nr:TonB-dependent receptor [Bacteroidales bacterium]
MKKPLFLILTFVSVLAYSQHKIDTNKIYPVDEVVISGTKTEVNRSQVPLTISLVNQEQIKQSSESALLPVLSEYVPGMFVTKRGVTGFGVATGAAGQISMRGIGGSPNTQVLVLLNGNPQYMGLMGHPLPDAYRSSNVKRVEVIRGPASTLYGSNAMGGVINIITEEATKEGFSGNASASYGSFSTLKASLNGGFNKNKVSVFAGVNYDKTDGHREASYFHIMDGYFRGSYEISKHFKVSGDFSLAQFETADPGLDTSEVIVHGDSLDIQRGLFSISADNQFERIDGSIRFFYNFGEHSIWNSATPSDFLSNDYNYGIIAYENLKLFTGNTITFGIDYKQFGGEATQRAFNKQLVDTSVYEAAGYALIQQRLFNNKINLNAGFRLENNEMFGLEPVPTAGINYSAGSDTYVKTSVSKGYRSPTIRELYMFFPNPELKPEELTSIEAGVEKAFSGNRARAELTVFYAKGDNIVKLVSGDGGMKYQNTGEIENKGIELQSKLKVNEVISLNMNYSYINMKYPVLATPEHKLFVSGIYSYKGLTTTLSIQYINNLYTFIGANSLTTDFTLINTRVSYNINDLINVYLKAENLLNTKYEINYGYPMPGILFFGGVNLHI